MKRPVLALAVIALLLAAIPMRAQQYGIMFGDLEVTEANASDIFGNGMASYDVNQNTLVLQDGFEYRLSHGLVSIKTGSPFHIQLEGSAQCSASFDIADDLVVEGVEGGCLSIIANISGSALKCEDLNIMPDVTLSLLSRNSQEGMFALQCQTLTVNSAILSAEVTTAQLAVVTKRLVMNGCWLKKPRGGGVNDTWGGICYADGLPAKTVEIVVEGFGLEEMDDPQSVKVEKVFEDGQIVIIKDGKRYDITGREVKVKSERRKPSPTEGR